LDRVRVLLQRGGDAEVRCYRDSTPTVFTGQWTEKRSGVVDLLLTRRDTNAIRATGQVHFRSGGELSRVEILGRERAVPLSVTFQTENEDRPSAAEEASPVVRGDGRLEIGRAATRKFDRVSVLLRRDGGAEVRCFRGSRPTVFTGQWSGDRWRGVAVRLTRRDDAAVQATGRIDFRRGRYLEQIEITGREGRERLSVTFQAERFAKDDRPFGYVREADEAKADRQ
jgi:hypothetical protein